MLQDTLFTKIIHGDLPADIIYRDDQITAFRDIAPQAPTHILIVPNKPIPGINDIEENDEQMLGRLFTVAQRLAAKEGIAKDGYRLIVNCGHNGGQEIPHLHLHLLGGKPLGRMLQGFEK